jgi:HSP20 family protein
LVVEAEVPGVAPEDLTVEVERDVLVLSGQLRAQVPQGYEAVQTERHTTPFRRAIKLLSEVHGERTAAQLERGLLVIHLPKREAKARQEIGVRVL